MSRQKEEQALRIMKALSGVDEELLERCGRPQPVEDTVRERDGVQGGIPAGMSRFWQTAGKAGGFCAAAVCLAVIWAVRWRAQVPGCGETIREEADAGVLCEEAENAVQENDSPQLSGGEVSGELNSEPWGGGEQEAALQQSSEEQEIAADEASQDKRTEPDLADDLKKELSESLNISVISVSWEEACALAGIEEQIRIEPPAEYVPSSVAVSGEEGGHVLQYAWSDGEHTLCLKLAGKDSVWIGDSALPVLNAADWADCLPEADSDGGIRFVMVLESGARLEYEGWLTKEELEALLDGLPDS